VIAYSAQHGSARRFLRGRFLRLYPAAWLVASASFAMLAIIPSYYWRSVRIWVYSDPAHLFNALALTGIAVTGSYWTLPIELAFYGCIFVLLLIGRLHWLRGFALALTVYGVPCLFVLALHEAWIIDAPWSEFGMGPWNVLLLRHGPLFALGLYLFAWQNGGLGRRDRWGAGLAMLLCLVEIACRSAQQLREHSITALVPLPLLIGETEALFLLAFAAMLASLYWNAAFPARLRRASRVLGLMTYPFYLVHEILGGLVVFLMLRAGAPPLHAVAGAVALVGVFAYVVSNRIEPVFRREIVDLLERARRRPAGGARNTTLGAT
jgi:peptidoglycan/LPS O-acetylase OafA/YrhL